MKRSSLAFLVVVACSGGGGTEPEACASGFTRQGADCVDVDECAVDNGGCGDPTYVTCTNNVGATPGCVDIDECAVDNGGCGDPASVTCTNALAAPPWCGPGPWLVTVGGTGIDIAEGVAADAQGNVVVTGYFESTVDFGGGSLASAGDWDPFVASYAPDGTHRWSKKFGASWRDIGKGVAVDGSGNVYAIGYHNYAVDFGGGSIPSNGQDDIYVVSYTQAGAFRWARVMGGANRDFGNAIAANASGQVAILGAFQGTIDLGTGPLRSAGDWDIFVALLDENGVTQWSRRYGDALMDYAGGVAIDGSGNVYWTGRFSGDVDFGGGVESAGVSGHIIAASLDAQGGYRWAHHIVCGSGEGLAAAALPNGDVAFAGWWSGTIALGETPTVGLGGREGFLVRYDTNGVAQWSKTMSSSSSEETVGVCLDPSGNVAISGMMGNGVTFPGATAPANGPIFVASWNPAGLFRWGHGYGTSGDFAKGRGVACHGSGNVTLVGEFRLPTDFGGGTLNSRGAADVYVVTLGPRG